MRLVDNYVSLRCAGIIIYYDGEFETFKEAEKLIRGEHSMKIKVKSE